MKSIFEVVHKISNMSGLAYSLEKGADVLSESQQVWDDIVKVNPPFCDVLSLAYSEYRLLRAQPNSNTRGGYTTKRYCPW